MTPPSRLRVVVLATAVAAAGGLAVLLTARGCFVGEFHFARGPFLQDLGPDHVTLAWRTDATLAGSLRVFEPQGAFERTVETPASAAEQRVTIDGLSPGRAYRYQVTIPGPFAGRAEGTFTTAPPPGQPLAFTVWGDSRSNPDICAALADLILKTGAPLSLHTGDFVNRGVDLGQWDSMFFEPCRDLLRSALVLPVMGNHELGTAPGGLDGRQVFIETFSLPGGRPYYSFDYGDAHFLVLDSMPDFAGNEDQYRFAVEDLQSTTARWRFAVWHHPVFNSGHHASHIDMRTRYCPLLARSNVDMILAGHDHNFQLSRPIRHQYEAAQQRPYRQLVSGGGGARLYAVRNDEIWSDKGHQVNHFVLCRINGDRLDAEVISLDGTTLDTFWIDKREAPPEAVSYELIELERLYQDVAVVDARGKPLPPLVLEENQTSGAIRYALANPLPEPMTVTVAFEVAGGLVFDPPTAVSVVPAQGSVTLECPFRVAAGRPIYPLTGPKLTLDAPVGSRTIQAAAPPIAVRRTIAAATTESSITVDGQGTEPGWQTAPAIGGFVEHTPSSIRYQDPEAAAEVRFLHDAAALYVLVVSNYPADESPQLGRRMAETDHAEFYLAGRTAELRFTTDILGLTERQGDLDEAIQAAFLESDRHGSWEIAVPLAKLIADAPAGEPLAFNLFVRRSGVLSSLSLTFGQSPSRETSARLTLR